MSRAKSGRYAAVYQSFSSLPIQSGFQEMSWSVDSKYASVGSSFWLHSYDHQVEVRVNGVVSGFAMTAGVTNTIQVAAGSVYIEGSLTAVAADSVAGLAPSTGSGAQLVYAICYDKAGGLTAVAGLSGAASTTRGSTGAPAFIPISSICIGYVVRGTGAAAIIPASSISVAGREWSNAPGVDELRPLLGRAYFLTVPAQIHTGAVPPKVYWRGYQFNENFVKIGEIRNWTAGATQASEDATTQNSFSNENDGGRISYTLSYEEFISEPLHTAFSHIVNGRGDRIYKLFPDRNVTTKYWACQGRENVSMSFPLDNKATSSNTVTITGRVEEFSA